MTFTPCVIIPTYDNPTTIRGVVEGVGRSGLDVIVVDDGSGREAREALDAMAREGLCDLVRRSSNGGKGAAVKAGLERAAERGFSHALQVDADGQHALEDVPRLLEVARERPSALVLGQPEFDASAPRGRLMARKLSVFWADVETRGHVIADPLCGFRVYPVGEALAAGARGDGMDFDPEIAVRMVWRGVPVINVPTRVRYVPPEQGGVSHFRLVRDNAAIAWMHTRLVNLAIARAVSRALGSRTR